MIVSPSQLGIVEAALSVASACGGGPTTCPPGPPGVSASAVVESHSISDSPFGDSKPISKKCPISPLCDKVFFQRPWEPPGLWCKYIT